ncbi:MAG: HupE/UreJ family protein [Pseudomonadota bacterium]
MRVLLVLLLQFWSVTAQAHALDPGYLQIQHLGGEAWQVFWRKPDVNGNPMDIQARLPVNCTPSSPPQEARFDGSAWSTQWIAICPDGLGGQRVEIAGLDTTNTEVLVRLGDAQGTTRTFRLTPAETGLTVPETLTGWGISRSYFGLGFDHILEGWDHLLFVFALLVLIRNPWRLAAAITAFTLAHSLTLALATLDLVRVPSQPVEAVIALSIVLLAVEILRRRQGGMQLTQRFPWILAFSFGLLHGLGFAGALGEIGLPQDDVPLALLAFNLGVEAGQLAFVAVVLAVFTAIRALMPRLSQALRDPRSLATIALGYGIGGVATYWLAERVSGF